MNNIWFFGDSFTHGTGCRPGDEYYLKYPPKKNDELWIDIVTKKLNLNHYVLTVGKYYLPKV